MYCLVLVELCYSKIYLVHTNTGQSITLFLFIGKTMSPISYTFILFLHLKKLDSRKMMFFIRRSDFMNKSCKNLHINAFTQLTFCQIVTGVFLWWFMHWQMGQNKTWRTIPAHIRRNSAPSFILSLLPMTLFANAWITGNNLTKC